MTTSGASSYRIAYEIAPIVLVGGIANQMAGGSLSILSILQSANYANVLSGGSSLNLDDPFAWFSILPGATLISNQLGKYPFANLQIAANSIIQQPLNVAMLMRIPVRDAGGYANKTAIMNSLQNTLQLHSQLEGTYTVATNVFFYNSAILLDLRCVDSGNDKQEMIEFQWEFEQPLLSQQQATQRLNSQMSALSSGNPTDGSSSGIGPSIGSPQSLAAPAVSPASAATAGSGIIGPNGGSQGFAGIQGFVGTPSGPAV